MRTLPLALLVALTPMAPALAGDPLAEAVAPAAGEAPAIPSAWTVVRELKKLPKPVRKAIKDGRAMLGRGELVPFLERFVHPDDRARMPDLEQVAEGFAGEKADRLAEAFDSVGDARVWEVEGPSGETGYAVGVTKVVDGLPKDMIFVEVDGRWRIKD